ncbi:MAG: hypothetical protein Q9183_003053, partial [Haloplaca sp. 2 TL-2023]
NASTAPSANPTPTAPPIAKVALYNLHTDTSLAAIRNCQLWDSFESTLATEAGNSFPTTKAPRKTFIHREARDKSVRKSTARDDEKFCWRG